MRPGTGPSSCGKAARNLKSNRTTLSICATKSSSVGGVAWPFRSNTSRNGPFGLCQADYEGGGSLAPATGRTAWPCRCLAAQLVPFETSSERNIEQCSPPLLAAAPTGHATHRKSQLAPPPVLGEGRGTPFLRRITLRGMPPLPLSLQLLKIERRQAAYKPVALTLRQVQ